jgi:hypothetical protein
LSKIEHDVIQFLKSQDLLGLERAYIEYSCENNLKQIKCLFALAEQTQENYHFYQDLVLKLIKSKEFPVSIINGINTVQRLNFFSPVFSALNAFDNVTEMGNNLLHVLFSSKSIQSTQFNYIRSLLMFERNESLIKALTARNAQKLTPIECYLAFNETVKELPNVELDAVLVLIKAQIERLNYDASSCAMICRYLQKSGMGAKLSENNHRIILISAIYNIKSSKVLTLVNT